MFQYISCYSLSFAKEILDIACKGFQYISCYSLSQPGIGIDYATGFQYISCYSLSSSYLPESGLLLCFNTSHVTLYRWYHLCIWRLRSVSIHLMLLFIMCYHRMSFFVKGFNTSHVTLYQFRKPRLYVLSAFQYISCYSLSMRLSEIKIPTDLFQYISCYSLSPY